MAGCDHPRNSAGKGPHSDELNEQLHQGVMAAPTLEQPKEHYRGSSGISPAVITSAAARHSIARISPPVSGAQIGVAHQHCNVRRPSRRLFAAAPTDSCNAKERGKGRKDMHPLLGTTAAARREDNAEFSEWAEWDALDPSDVVGKDTDTTAEEEQEFLDAWEILQSQIEPLKSAIREHDDHQGLQVAPATSFSCVAVV